MLYKYIWILFRINTNVTLHYGQPYSSIIIIFIVVIIAIITVIIIIIIIIIKMKIRMIRMSREQLVARLTLESWGIFGYFWCSPRVFFGYFWVFFGVSIFWYFSGVFQVFQVCGRALRLSQGAGNGNSEEGGGGVGELWWGQQPDGSGRNPALPSRSKGSRVEENMGNFWQFSSSSFFFGTYSPPWQTHTCAYYLVF